MTHHPLDWLEENDRQTIENLLTANYDLVLLGHNHNPASVSGVFNAGPCLMLHSPAVHSVTSTGSNAYSIIQIDAMHKRYEIVYRSYSQPRDCFVAGEDLAPNGIKYPTPEDRTHWHQIRTQTASELLARLQNSGPIDFDDWYNKHIISKTKSRHQLVEPRVTRVKTDGAERQGGVSQALMHRLGIASTSSVCCRTPRFRVNQCCICVFPACCGALRIVRSSSDLRKLKQDADQSSDVASRGGADYADAVYPSRDGNPGRRGGLLYIFDQIGLPENGSNEFGGSNVGQIFPQVRICIILCGRCWITCKRLWGRWR